MARVVDSFFNNRSDTPPIPLTAQTRFYPMLYMINHPQTRLEYLTASSLKGFMVTLSCPTASQYTELTSSDIFGRKKNIDWYLLKFVVVTRYETSLDPFIDNKQNKTYKKSSETEESFIAEGQLQQQLNLNNNIGKHREFIPPVLSFALFTNTESKKMLNILINKCGHSYPNFEGDIMRYLLDRIYQNSDYEIGILVMPMLNKSMPLYEYLRNANHTVEITRKAQLVSNVVNLLLFLKTIHMDLHLNNALRVDKEVYLIDFGRASDLRSGRRDEYFNPNSDTPQKKSKYEMLSDISNFEVEFRNMKDPKTPPPTQRQKIDFMKKVVYWVWDQEKKGNIGKYGRQPNNPFSQMEHWVPQLTPDIYEQAYDILVSDTTDKSDAISYNEIKRANSFNFGLPAREYYVTLPPYIKDVVITGNPQQQQVRQQQVRQQQVQLQQPNEELTTLQKGVTIVLLLAFLYKCFAKGGSKQIMFGGEESSIEEIREYIKNNNLESMIIEMVQTDTCPIGENAEYAQKLYEMLSSIPQEKQSEIILYSNEIQESMRVEGGRRARKMKTKKAKKNRTTRRTRRNKKQRKTRRR